MPQTEDITLIHWYEKAQDITFQLRPGDPWPDEMSATTSPSVSATDGGSCPDPTRPPEQDEDDRGDGDLGTDAIAGIAAGGAGALLLACLATFYHCRRKRRRRRRCNCHDDEGKSSRERKVPDPELPPTGYTQQTRREPPKRPPRSPVPSFLAENKTLANGSFAVREPIEESPVLPRHDMQMPSQGRSDGSRGHPILDLGHADESTGSYSLASY